MSRSAAVRVLTTLVAGITLLDLCGVPAAAGTESALEVVDVDTSGHPFVSLTLTAPDGLAGVDLVSRHFAVDEGGVRRTPVVRRLPDDALEVVLVVDTSGSMQGEPLAAAQEAAVGFVDAMPPSTRIAVLGFGDAPEVASGFSAEPDPVVSAIDGLTAGGETALYDALVTAVEHMTSHGTEGSRRFVVVLSDGGDTASTHALEEAASALAASAAGVYAVALATSESDLGALATLTRETSGGVVAASDPSEIAGVYDTIASQLVNQYTLRYRSNAEGPTEVRVAVRAGEVAAAWRETVDLPPLPADVAARIAPPSKPFVAPEPGVLAREWWFLAGIVPMGLALLIASFLLVTSKRSQRVAAQIAGIEPVAVASSAVSNVSERATALAERALAPRGRLERLDVALDRAGLAVRPGEYVVLAVGAAIGGALPAFLVAGPVGAAIVMLTAAAVAARLPGVLRVRRQRRLADQLGDTLQLLAGSLRSGHGLAQALDMVTREADSPTAEEFHRVIVEVRLGRDIGEALDALADRAGNEDFQWVVEAIRIHREVGGDLAEILDRVGETIRDRNRVRGQIRSLTAEGRLSAILLMALPFVVGAWMWFTNRPYISELVERPAGRVALAVGATLMSLGAVVLRRLVRPEF